VYCGIIAKTFKMFFGLVGWVDPRNDVIDGGLDFPW